MPRIFDKASGKCVQKWGVWRGNGRKKQNFLKILANVGNFLAQSAVPPMTTPGIFEHRLLSEATRETEKTSSCRPDFSPRFDDPSSKISGRRKQKHPLWFAGKICEHHGLELRKNYLPPEARLARQLNLQHAYVSYAAIVIRRALECYDLRLVKGKFVFS